MTNAAQFPKNYDRRIDLNDEVHARPPEPVSSPARVIYLAMLSEYRLGSQEAMHVAELASSFGVPGPAPTATHYSAQLGAIRLKWERHTEFARYTFIGPAAADDAPFSEAPMTGLPRDWVSALPGEVLAAIHAEVRSAKAWPHDFEDTALRLFNGNALVGSKIAGGDATALTDCRIRDDGFSRILVLDEGMTAPLAGRMVQRLLEVETYRILALLAFPVARELAPLLTRCGADLARITAEMTQSKAADEAVLLDQLTQLEAQIEERASVNHYRFGAAAAYYDLVQARIAELREDRIQGLQTFQEFTERRLSPAMNTCSAVANRQESLSRRVSRATNLLSTRVGIMQERQNQALLESMNRRARLQLRLQETVEGLSVVAISYYVASLVGICAKGMNALGVPVDPAIVTLLSIPVILLIAAMGVRRIRRMVTSGGTPK